MDLALVRDVVCILFLLGGSFFSIVGAIGVVRFPDFYTRLHGAGVIETLGAGLILVGLMVQSGVSLASVKLLMILAFLLVTNPTACHALAQAALSEGIQPEGAERLDEVSATDAGPTAERTRTEVR